MRTLLLVVAVGALLAGCATREWHQVNDACVRIYRREIPPHYERVLVEEEKEIEVPDGNIQCTTKNGKTDCTQGTRIEYIPYTTLKTVDTNANRRQAAIEICTKHCCMNLYRNEDCEPKGK